MSEPDFEVVVVGNAGVDTCVHLYGADVDWSVEANFTENVDYVGQAGGFTSRGYAQLGRRTAFLGSVGEDPCGRFVLDELARDGVDTSAVFVDPAGTTRSVNVMYRDGRRKNFYDGRGHMTLVPDLERCRRLLSRTRLAHVHLPNWARTLLPAAKELGVTVACDLQDIVSADDPYRADFVRHADILFFSCVNHPDPAPLVRDFLRGRPDRIVVVGLGARGCALGTRDGIRFFEPVPMEAPVVDTNGAGDSLAVGFLSSWVLDGYPLERSVRRGQLAARHCCAQRASTSHLITRARLDELDGPA